MNPTDKNLATEYLSIVSGRQFVRLEDNLHGLDFGQQHKVELSSPQFINLIHRLEKRNLLNSNTSIGIMDIRDRECEILGIGFTEGPFGIPLDAPDLESRIAYYAISSTRAELKEMVERTIAKVDDVSSPYCNKAFDPSHLSSIGIATGFNLFGYDCKKFNEGIIEFVRTASTEGATKLNLLESDGGEAHAIHISLGINAANEIARAVRIYKKYELDVQHSYY